MNNNIACGDPGHTWSTKTPKGALTRKQVISTETRTTLKRKLLKKKASSIKNSTNNIQGITKTKTPTKSTRTSITLTNISETPEGKPTISTTMQTT